MKKAFSMFLAFLLLSIFGYLIFLTISWFARSFAEIDPTIGAAIIAGATTVISSAYITSLNARKAKDRAAFEAHRERKAEVYDNFMNMVMKVLKNAKSKSSDGTVIPENDLEEFFHKFTSKVLIYGGPGVVKAFSDWRVVDPQDKMKPLVLIDKLFREMRKDLGESNKGIDNNELIGLFIIGGKSELEETS